MSDAATRSVSQAGVGTAELNSELDSDGKYTISGIALGAGDVTVGNSGIKKQWPAAELKQAASSLQGKPLVRDHQNNSDGRVGTVTKAFYDEGVGVRYEAEIASHYEQLAKDVAAGIQEVSARAYHDPVEELEETESGAKRVTSILFDNLSVVSQGASPSNTAEIGGLDTSGAVAMAAGPKSGAVATLESGVERSTAQLAEYSKGDWVKGDSSGGTWHGKVRGMKSDGCYSDEIDGDQEICAGDSTVYLIENYDPESGEFTDTMVAHKEDSISMWDHDENRFKAAIDAEAAELEGDEEDLDSVYSEWSEHVNMSASDLERWADHPCANKASVDPEAVIDRNMHLLDTNKSEWGSDEIEDAKRTISFISRMSDEENEPDDPRDGPSGCPSKWAISLLNWAYNPFDSIPDVPDEMAEENGLARRTDDSDMTNMPDRTDMPKSMMGDAPEWDEGDLVRWQVEPDLFGKIVHVDEAKNIVMVEIMGLDDGSMESTGFTITAGYSDIKPMQTLMSKADMSMHEDEMAQYADRHDAELATINGLDINGTVMWDGNMGTIAGFETDDGTLMVEIDAIDKEDGQFTKTGDTMQKPLHEVESMSASAVRTGSTAELEATWHTPEYDGTDADSEWDKPAMSDFDTDNMSEIDDHFIVSKTGEWPPENYGDLALPVVFPNGDLSLDGLDSAHQMAGQVDGISDDMADELQSKINAWAEDEFDEPVAGESMAATSQPNLQVASLDNDARTGSSTVGNTSDTTDITTMTDTIEYDALTDEEIEEMSEPVVIEQDDVESLRSKAEDADELASRLEDVNSSIDELAENQEKLDSVDEDALDELQAHEEPVVLGTDEYEELNGLVDEIGTVFADELAEYSPFESEELQDRFTPLELRDKVTEHDEASVTGELGATESDPEPEGGSVSKEELSEGEPSEMSEEELREAVAEHLEDGKMHRQAEKIRSGEIGLAEMGIDVETVLD